MTENIIGDFIMVQDSNEPNGKELGSSLNP